MRRPKGIVHVDVCQSRHLLGQLQIVLFLALVEASVLQHHDFARLQLFCQCFHFGADGVGRHLDGNPQMRRQNVRGSAQAELWVGTAFRSSQMAHQKQRGALVQHILDSRQGGFDALVIGDLAILHGHVEIHAHQDALTFEIDISYSFLVHGMLPTVDKKTGTQVIYLCTCLPVHFHKLFATSAVRSAVRQA